MLNGSVKMIILKIREIRGITLDDNPYLWKDILEAFDGFQRARISGLEVAKKIMSETSLWLGVSLSGGKESYWYFRNANHIAYSCHEELRPFIDTLYSKVTQMRLGADEVLNLIGRVKEVMLVLKDIEKLALKSDVMQIHRELVKMLISVRKMLFI